MTNVWIEHVKQYAKTHNISYKQALSDARTTYTKVTPKTKPLSLRQQLRECENERNKLREDIKRKPVSVSKPPPKNINELSLVEQFKLILDSEGDSEEILHQIEPKRRSQIRNLMAKARQEAKATGMKGQLEPVLNKVTGKYEIDPARSPKQKTGFNNQREMDAFIRARYLELAEEAESKPTNPFAAFKFKKKGNGSKRRRKK